MIRWALWRFVRRSGGGRCAAEGGRVPFVRGLLGDFNFCDFDDSAVLRSSMRMICVSAVRGSIRG